MKKFMLFCLFTLGLTFNSVIGMEQERKSQKASCHKLLSNPIAITTIKIAIILAILKGFSNIDLNNQYNGIGRLAFLSSAIYAAIFAAVCEQSYSREDMEDIKKAFLAIYGLSMVVLIGSALY